MSEWMIRFIGSGALVFAVALLAPKAGFWRRLAILLLLITAINLLTRV
jgi:hypothetical protein